MKINPWTRYKHPDVNNKKNNKLNVVNISGLEFRSLCIRSLCFHAELYACDYQVSLCNYFLAIQKKNKTGLNQRSTVVNENR